MKPNNFEQILEKFMHKTYEYESYLKHNHITTIKYENNSVSFLCEGIQIFTMKAEPVFTIQKLDKDIEQAVDAVDEEFLLFEHKNSSVDKIFNYCQTNEDQFTDIFKNPYKFNEDTYIFTSAMIMSVTDCEAIVPIEYEGYSVVFAATSEQGVGATSEQVVEGVAASTTEQVEGMIEQVVRDAFSDESNPASDKASNGSETVSDHSAAYHASDEASNSD